MTDEEQVRILRNQLPTVAEALRPCMPRVADLLDETALTIDLLVAELDRVLRADR